MRNTIYRTKLVAAFVALSIAFGVAAEEPDRDDLNLKGGQLALSGYDLVSYWNGAGPVEGRKEFVEMYRDVEYRFSSEENLAAFRKSPESYLPEFGGWCAWAMLDGEKVDVNPETYKIFDGKLLLFYDGFWGDTLKRWKAKVEKELEADLYETASKNWAKLIRE